MSKKIFSLNLDEDLKKKLIERADMDYTSVGSLINKFIATGLNVDKTRVEEKKIIKEQRVSLTKEEHLADWEYRKEQVKKGNLPKNMAVEYPDNKEVEMEFEEGYQDYLKKDKK